MIMPENFNENLEQKGDHWPPPPPQKKKKKKKRFGFLVKIHLLENSE